jgi:hypothetical protein
LHVQAKQLLDARLPSIRFNTHTHRERELVVSEHVHVNLYIRMYIHTHMPSFPDIHKHIHSNRYTQTHLKNLCDSIQATLERLTALHNVLWNEEEKGVIKCTMG